MAEYINKDELLQAYAEIRPNLATKVGEFTEILENFPTADIQPVKRGHWEKPKSVIIYCSVCGNEAYWDTDYGQQLFDYCPYCGADMREPLKR